MFRLFEDPEKLLGLVRDKEAEISNSDGWSSLAVEAAALAGIKDDKLVEVSAAGCIAVSILLVKHAASMAALPAAGLSPENKLSADEMRKVVSGASSKAAATLLAEMEVGIRKAVYSRITERN